MITKKIYLIIISLLITSSSLLSTTRIVPTQYSTINAAIAASVSGDIVQVNSGTHTVTSSITIPKGVTLDIKSGATINITGGININGSLISNNVTINITNNSSIVAHGKLTCTKTTFKGTNWHGIGLFSGANNSTFTDCKFSGVTNSDNTNIWFNSNTGITILRCEFESGIHSRNSIIYLGKNKLNAKGFCAVEARENSTLYFGVSGTTSSCNAGNNAILNGTALGILGEFETNLDLESANCTYNNLAPSSPAGNTTRIAVLSYSSVTADYTYWGSASNQIIANTGSTFSNTNSLTCQPTAPFRIGVIEDNNSMTAMPELKKVTLNESSSNIEKTRKANELAFYEQYSEAFDIYKSILSSTENDTHIAKALTAIRAVYGATEDKAMLEFVKNYTKDKTAPYIKTAYANMLALNDKNFEEALIEYDKIAKNNPNTDYGILAIISQAYIYYLKNDETKVDEIIEYLEKIAPENSGFNTLKSTVRLNSKKNDEAFEYEEIKETEVEIAGYSLSNYPNPFNPTTTIQYTIPKDEFVKLAVYDVTGRVVKELVSSHKTAGKYSVEFNASGYSSGTYYYKIEAGEYKNIQKMMLVK